MDKRATNISDNLNQISVCFKRIYTVLYYSGCVCFKMQKGVFHLTKTTILFTNLMRLTLLIGFFTCMAIKSSGNRGSRAMMEPLAPVLKLLLVLQVFNCTIAYSAASIIMERNKDKHIKVMERLQQLDDGLQMHFPHINWNYHKTEFKFTVSTLIVTAYFYSITFVFLYQISNCQCDYVTTFVLALCYVTMTTGPACISFLHMGIMDLQCIRYRLLKKLLQQQYAKRATATFKYMRDNEFEMQLMRLVDYLKNYIQLILKFNDVFSFVCAIIVFHDFAILTFLTFLMCQLASETNPQIERYLFIFLFMIAPIYKLSVYGVYGHRVFKEQQNAIHEVRICENYYRHSKTIRNYLRSFLHWQMQNSYTFLIGKVIRCDLAVVFMALNSIAASTLVLIQLQFQQNSLTKGIESSEYKQERLQNISDMIITHRPSNVASFE